MNKKTIVWIGIYAVVAYGAYYLFFSKKAYAKKILASGKYTSSIDNLLSFDMAYLREWASAATKNEPVFTHKGVTYITKGGKIKK